MGNLASETVCVSHNCSECVCVSACVRACVRACVLGFGVSADACEYTWDL